MNDRLRFILLQARSAGDPCRLEEQESFAERLGVDPERIHCYDLLQGPPSTALVTSRDCPLLPDKPVWAFQFHPELDVAANRSRLTRYRDGYLHVMSVEEFERTLEERFAEGPETEQLPGRFLEVVFGN